jgi:2-octaprenyl-6-methoxyphenol hydroxylase
VLRIGNAAQTLHPVAGQGLNLGLRDAFAVAQALEAVPHRQSLDAALAGVSWQRAPDRLGLLLTTDALARGFAWQGPVWPAARALGLSALAACPPWRRQLAQRLMWGWR